MTTKSITKQIDDQISFLHRTRAIFPYFPPEAAGKQTFKTGKYFKQKGHDVSMQFSKPLTDADITHLNSTGHWINQNFIIRLYAILESNGLFPKTLKLTKK